MGYFSGCIPHLLLPSSSTNKNVFSIIFRFCGLARGWVVCAIYLDEPFITIVLGEATEFIKIGILPELVGKLFSKETSVISSLPSCYSSDVVWDSDEQDLEWCYCRKCEYGKIICCDTKDCPVPWYHSCLKITCVAKAKWFCL